jgi:hypothetical protein
MVTVFDTKKKLMFISMSSSAISYFGWVLGSVLAANLVIFIILAFVPGVHQRITSSLLNFIQKL